MTPQEEIRTRALHIADKIVSMDYFSAKLRWEYSTALREGNFTAKTIMDAHSHMSEVNLISTVLLGLLEELPPIITSEPVPAPEKEQPVTPPPPKKLNPSDATDWYADPGKAGKVDL